MPQPAIAAATSGTATSVARRRIVREARRKSRNIGVDVITHIPGEPERTVTTESTFLAAADATLAAIGAAIDHALEDADADLDWNLVDGILEIACEDGSKVIVNRHAPNREIWVAARRGGFHFRGDGGRWRDARGGGELGATLSAILREQAGLAVAFGDLAAPGTSG
ncbi:MAG: iron donor protein CyaY [Betaproteobacteria bacterium]|nr:iron donor protein CyaY [Betaproteobacteria bacterium]